MIRKRPHRYAMPSMIRTGDTVTVEWPLDCHNGQVARYTLTATVAVEMHPYDPLTHRLVAGNMEVFRWTVNGGRVECTFPDVEARLILEEAAPEPSEALPLFENPS